MGRILSAAFSHGLLMAVPAAWAQEAAETAEKEGVSPAFWIAVSVPIVLGVALALRAATSSKKKPD